MKGTPAQNMIMTFKYSQCEYLAKNLIKQSKIKQNARYLHACSRCLVGSNIGANGNTTMPMAGKTSYHESKALAK